MGGGLTLLTLSDCKYTSRAMVDYPARAVLCFPSNINQANCCHRTTPLSDSCSFLLFSSIPSYIMRGVVITSHMFVVSLLLPVEQTFENTFT